MTPFGTETPAVQGPGFGDLQGGITLAGGVCAALFHRERTGEPSVVDSSLLAQAMWSIAPSISVADLFGIDGIPGAPPGLAINPLVNRYKTRDGRWIQMVFLQPDRLLGRLLRADRPARARHRRTLRAVEQPDRQRRGGVRARRRRPSRARISTHWRKALADEPGVWAALATPKETLNDPQVEAERLRHPQRRRPGHRVPDRRRTSAIQRNTARGRTRSRTWTAHRGDPVGARPRLGRHLGGQGQRRDSVEERRNDRSGASSNRSSTSVNRRSRGSSSTGPTRPTPRTPAWCRKSTPACTRPTATKRSRS